MKEQCFIPFIDNIHSELVPHTLNNPFELVTPDICKIAALQIQAYLLKHQSIWKHNFGFCEHKEGNAKGKMFGVLVVKNKYGDLGFLSTFSGKIQDEPHPNIFVPSVFDVASNDFFINKGMSKLSEMGLEIKDLININTEESILKANKIKELRKHKSVKLQEELFDNYRFQNTDGEVKKMRDIFKVYANRNPAAGAGECAAPKLLQYAFENDMKPLAIAEFWWGKSTKSEDKVNKEFYPACNDKCRPILSFMLGKEF